METSITIHNTKSIFTTLLTDQIPFAVCVAINSTKTKGLDWHSREYFITVKDENRSYFKKLGFRISTDYKGILEITLLADEVKEFKDSQDLFVKVKSDSWMRVYELKDRSFYDYFHGRVKVKLPLHMEEKRKEHLERRREAWANNPQTIGDLKASLIITDNLDHSNE